MTVPRLRRLDSKELNRWYWTPYTGLDSAALEKQFPSVALEVVSSGNVFAECAFLQGLTTEELFCRDSTRRTHICGNRLA
jgi:hypothetical protein